MKNLRNPLWWRILEVLKRKNNVGKYLVSPIDKTNFYLTIKHNLKMSNEKTAVNGKANAGVVVPAKVENQKPELSNVTVGTNGKVEKKELTVAEKIEKLQQLNSIKNKHEVIDSSLKKIKSFKLATDKSEDEFFLTNAKGNEFRSSNSQVIGDVVELIISRLEKQKIEVETEFVF